MSVYTRRVVRWTIVAAVAAVFSVSCENPFQVGLGSTVDIEPPSVRVGSLENGDYVRGTITLSGTASDDRTVDRVTIQFTEDGETVSMRADLERTNGEWEWSYKLDTTKYSDGEKNFVFMSVILPAR